METTVTTVTIDNLIMNNNVRMMNNLRCVDDQSELKYYRILCDATLDNDNNNNNNNYNIIIIIATDRVYTFSLCTICS